MNKILIIGAGHSSSTLIKYLINEGQKESWEIIVADLNYDLAIKKSAGYSNVEGIKFDISDTPAAENTISNVDVVISMLPAFLHIEVAKVCLRQKKHLLTASYNTEEISALSSETKSNDNLILMEMGLDPGIDHMSAMRVIDKIRSEGHYLDTFETFTGGLLAANGKDNPWNYKFTWNPRNVVLAGQGIVKFIQEGRFKYIPYHKLFRRTERIHIPDHGYFEGYANRDSLKYRSVYGLEDVRTLYRGTLRRPGFCKAWNIFVQLGATDDTYQMEGVKELTHRQFLNSFLYYNPHDSIELKLAHYMGLEMEGEEMYMLRWIGMFDEEPVGIDKGTPAQILEHILKKKWTLSPEDKDMIVMYHKFIFRLKDSDELKEINSHMVVLGDDAENTGMSKTVGLPLAIATKLLMKGKIKARGVCVPTDPLIYEPVLNELESVGIIFNEYEVK
ncbi:saccharopine dehydrogenase NADP-binding domain-containing protein [Hyphobacterium sp. CCMP332]|nr:saccharopine dehydrogenase NADP-binding domain-containing protein [Hyphobacterium sp. CCMP332]